MDKLTYFEKDCGDIELKENGQVLCVIPVVFVDMIINTENKNNDGKYKNEVLEIGINR